MSDYFTGHGVDQATIQLVKFGLRGAALGEYAWLISLTLGFLFLSLAMLGIFLFRSSVIKPIGSFKIYALVYCLLSIALLCNPATINFYNLPTGTFIPSRASSMLSVAEFYKYYQRPHLKSVSKDHKNLVFIYAESLERAFFNEDYFPDLVPHLKEIEQQSISFTNMHLAPGTGGTIWAMSASQCGLPLFLPSQAILNKGTGEFLPSATCLGDMLSKDGYYLSYYGGASLDFTGKGNFFKTHGFTEVLGKHELLPRLKDPDYLSFWGVYDDSLLEIAYSRFLELSKTKDKFGLFLLTLDTHSPGYPSKKCKNNPYLNGQNKHLNAVACSDFLIGNFVNMILDSPYRDKTLIVIASDHINWNGTPTDDLLKKARDGDKNSFMIIDPSLSSGTTIGTKGSAMDIGPTILPFLGYKGQIGLGRDLLAQDINAEDERSFIQKKLYPWQTEILKFWGQPRIRKSLAVDISNNTVSIDKKDYNFPIFIELTDDLSTTLLFGFNGTCEQHLKKMDPNKRFLMVGKCRFIRTSEGYIRDHGIAMGSDGWCLIAGKGKKYTYKTKLESNVHYNNNELENLFTPQHLELTMVKEER